MFLSIGGMEQGVPLAPWIHMILFCFVLVRIRLTNKSGLGGKNDDAGT